MRMASISLWLDQFRWFARAAAAYRLKRFKARRLENIFAEKLRDESLLSNAFRELLWLATPSLVLASLAVAALAWLEHAITASGLQIPSKSASGTYSDVMLGLASMGGVFIGLYYAAVSAVATRAYSDVRAEILFLFAADTAGRTYMRLLTFVTCFALLHLALQLSVGYTSPIAAVFALALGAVSVVVFVRLGNRAFHLLDPTTLTQELLRELDHWSDRALRRRSRSAEPEFQQYARSRGERAVATLEAIADRTMTTVASRASAIPTLCSKLLRAEIAYLSKKSQIPSDSRWYPQVNVQRRWFTTSDSITSIAAQTGTGLQPEARPDRLWVEKKLDHVLERLVCSLSGSSNADQLLSCLSVLSHAMQRRAGVGDVLGCVAAWENICASLSSTIAKRSDPEAQKVMSLAVIDALGSIPVNIAIGFREYLERLHTAKRLHDVAIELTSTRWRFPFLECPFHMTERIN